MTSSHSFLKRNTCLALGLILTTAISACGDEETAVANDTSGGNDTSDTSNNNGTGRDGDPCDRSSDCANGFVCDLSSSKSGQKDMACFFDCSASCVDDACYIGCAEDCDVNCDDLCDGTPEEFLQDCLDECPLDGISNPDPDPDPDPIEDVSVDSRPEPEPSAGICRPAPEPEPDTTPEQDTTPEPEEIDWAGGWSAHATYTANCNWSMAEQVKEVDDRYTISITAEGNIFTATFQSGSYSMSGIGNEEGLTLSGQFPGIDHNDEIATEVFRDNNVEIVIDKIEDNDNVSGTLSGTYDTSGGWSCSIANGVIEFTR